LTTGQHCPRPTPDPTRAGYLFDGWFNEDTPLAYDFNQPVTTDNLTLKAHWTKNNDTWNMTPDHGTTQGGDTITLTPPPPRGIRFTQTSTGEFHSLAIGSDGNLYTWGRNQYGELGRTTTSGTDPTPSIVAKPAGAPAGFTWTQATAGWQYSMAIGSDGNLYTWGDNQFGQLGRDTNSGTLNPNPTPAVVAKPAGAPAGFTWTQAITGWYHSMAVGSDGNLYTWGDNEYGQLGRATNSVIDPTPGPVDKPAGAPTGFTWTQATAGIVHSMAVGSDGNLYTWGNNLYGQLGRTTNKGNWKPNPTPGMVDKPTGAPAGFTWTQATVGRFYSMAVGSDGNLYTWGSNNCGQLGRTTNSGTTPTPGPVDKPTDAPAGFTWTQASAGYTHSMAVGSDGNLYTWGDNNYGQLGRATPTVSPNPMPGPVDKPAGAPAGFTWTQASAGDYFSMAVGSDGNLYTWGDNQYGQLGRTTNTGTTNPNPVPDRADPPGTGPAVPTGVAFGGAAGTTPAGNTDGTWRVTTPAHAAGQADTVITWTRNNAPQADTHLPYTYEAPSHTVNFDPDGGTPTPPDQQVAEGQRASRPADPVKTGHVFDGWFITGTPVAYDFNRPVTGHVDLKAHWSPTPSWTISPGHGSELGGEQVTLTPPAPRGIRFTQISTGYQHSMAIGSDGNLYTWGSNLYGQLGRDTNTSFTDPTPAMVAKPTGAPAGFTWTQATAGWQHSMAVGSDGNLYTWGNNNNGQLGRTTNNTANPTPGMVAKPTGAPAGFTWTQATAGYIHSMAIGSDGNLYTWGSNSNGQLGRTTNNNTPGMVAKPAGAPAGFTWTQAIAGWGHSMAIGSDGNLYTWGSNSNGQLGRTTNNTANPTPGMVAKPTGAPTGFTWTQATAGYIHSMAIGSDGNLYTWGSNSNGQLGRTTNNNTADPTPGMVAKPAGAPTGFTWTQATAGYIHSMAIGSDGNLYTWGNNRYGQLGRDTNSGTTNPNPTPGLPDKPAGAPTGFTWTQATAGWGHSLAVGSDGNLYTWGYNQYGQLGRTTTNTTNNPTPGPVAFPGPAIPTGVRFGTTPGTAPAANTDGTWRTTTPAHTPGTVTVTIDWTRDGAVQTPDTGNRYEFRTLAVLPLAGGEGILPLLLMGLLAMAATLAGRRHRQDTATQTSPE
uniref:RCC1 domain-containing protein n=2 Tax=Bifidobacterium indicum TaxID=1691 RepID=UPI0030DAD8DC